MVSAPVAGGGSGNNQLRQRVLPARGHHSPLDLDREAIATESIRITILVFAVARVEPNHGLCLQPSQPRDDRSPAFVPGDGVLIP